MLQTFYPGKNKKINKQLIQPMQRASSYIFDFTINRPPGKLLK